MSNKPASPFNPPVPDTMWASGKVSLHFVMNDLYVFQQMVYLGAYWQLIVRVDNPAQYENIYELFRDATRMPADQLTPKINALGCDYEIITPQEMTRLNQLMSPHFDSWEDGVKYAEGFKMNTKAQV